MINFSGIPIESIDLENFLKKNIQVKEICQKILFQRIIQKAVLERGLTVSEDEIQEAADIQRRQRRLERANDTLAWLDEQLISPEDWEAGIQDELLSRKLSQELFSQFVERYFAENRLNFDRVVLYRMVIPYEKLAWEVFYQVEEEEISFYQAAHLYDVDEKRRLTCGYEGRIYRYSLPPSLAARVFSARGKEILQPIEIDREYHILMAEEFVRAELTSEVREEIIERLFSEWLTNELNYLIYQS